MQKKFKITTTLDLLRKHGACESGYRTLLKSLGPKWPKDKPINLLRILKSNGVEDVSWCFRATIEDSTIPRVLCAADFAESVLKYCAAKYPNDDRPAKAIKAARDFAAGKITEAEAAGAAEAAWAAEAAAEAAGAAEAAWAAEAAAEAAGAAGAAAEAAWAAGAAGAAAEAAWAAEAAEAAAEAAGAAGAAAWAAEAAAGAAEREKQATIIRKYMK